MKKWKFSQKQTALILAGLYAAALIPVLLLAFYNYPCADDFGFSAYSHIAWKESHSVWEVIKAACRTVAERYVGWQGTFSSIFVMALQPGLFVEEAYALTPYLMIGAMSISTLFFLYTVLVRGMKVDRWLYVSVSMLFLLFALEGMIDKTQAFFWFNGAAHYMIPHAMMLVMLALFLRLVWKEKKPILLTVFASLAAVFTGGGNYITALTGLLLILTGYALLFYFRKGKRACRLHIPALFYTAAFILNVAAPGNAVREGEMLVRPGVIKSIFLSFYYCTEFFSEEWMNWTYPVFLLLMAPLAYRIVRQVGNRFTYPLPVLVPVYSYCLLSSMFTPSLFATNEPGGGRIYNIIYLMYLMLVLLNLVYLLGWVWQKAQERGLRPGEEDCGAGRWFAAAVLAFAIFNAGMYAKVDPDFFTSVSAAKSLISGEAAAYEAQAKARNAILNDPSVPDAKIPEYTVKPELLFFDDIDENPDDWRNRLMCRYYEKESVKLVKAEQAGEE